jgi:hypothetical protein
MDKKRKEKKKKQKKENKGRLLIGQKLSRIRSDVEVKSQGHR